MYRILGLFIFFPFLGIIDGIDVQPLFILFYLFFVIISVKERRFDSSIYFIFLVLLMFVFRLYFFQPLINTPLLVARAVVSILTPVSVYYLVHKDGLIISNKELYWFTGVILSIAVIQLIQPDFATGLVSRDSQAISRLVKSGRGCRSLFPEPSTFGKHLILTNILFLLNSDTDKRGKYISFVLFLASAFLVRSAYSVFFHFLVLTSYYKKSFLLAALALLPTVYLAYHFLDGSRIVRVFESVILDPEYVMRQGAFRRLYNIRITLNDFNFSGLQGAVGDRSYYTASVHTLFGTLDYSAGGRNLGGALEYFLLYGIFSVPFYTWFILSLKGVLHVKSMLIFGWLLFFLFQDGSVSNPFTWYVFYYCLRSRKNIDENSSANLL